MCLYTIVYEMWLVSATVCTLHQMIISQETHKLSNYAECLMINVF